MATFRDCLDEVRRAHGAGATDDDAMASIDAVDRRAARLMSAGGLSRDDAIAEAGRQLAGEERAAAAKEQANRLMNLRKRIGRRSTIEEAAKQLGTDETPDLATALRNQVVAISTPTRGGRFSAEAFWKARSKEYTGLIVELSRAGLLQAVRRGDIEAQWVRELYERSKQEAGEPATPGVTGNKQAAAIADLIHRYQTLAKDRLNEEGAWIGDYAGYITRTAHDPNAIRKAGFEGWRDAILPKLDQERTFEVTDNPEKMLRGIYDALYTGVHLNGGGGVGFKDPAFTGPGNLARKASAERVLHFRDADAWLAYQKQFGSGTIFEQVLGGLDHAARQESLMSRWGTNPRAEFENDVQFFKQTTRGTSNDAVVRLGAREKQLGRLFSMLDGRANMPENQLASQIASDIRTVKSMASLGAVAITHFSAAVTKAAELRYQGVGFLERYGDFVTSIVKGRGRGQERDLADLMLAGTEGMHGRILDRFQPDDTVPGTLSKIANRFFSATGLTYLLDAQKAGAMRVMSRHLGRLVDTEHGALPPEVRRGLLQYGITPEEWEALRTAPDHTTMDDGRVFLTPDAARRSTADLSDKQRDALALKLHAYFSDVADRSIVTPGIADRYLLTGGTAPGTALGEVMRFVAQFKTWGVAAARQGFGRELYGGQGVAGAASGVFQMAAGAAAMGYLVMTLKGLTNGQEPRPPNSVATWTAAMIQGGGFGILGDYLFGEYNRFGGGFGESLLGPVLGQGASDIINIWNDIKNEPDDVKGRTLRDLGGDTLKIAQGWTPFVNLFYTRALVNYLFVNELQEAMNPGYLRRHEQIVKRLNGTDYWLSPSRVHQQGLPAALGVGR